MKRIFHTWDKWECYRAGFYDHKPKDASLSKEDAERKYAEFLKDSRLFAETLDRILDEWPMSCEHYLSNVNMNRLAWLGQAACCLRLGIPSCFRGGFNMLTEAEQLEANSVALSALNKWLRKKGEDELTLDGAASRTKADLY